jgi:hypothetical protein
MIKTGWGKEIMKKNELTTTTDTFLSQKGFLNG